MITVLTPTILGREKQLERAGESVLRQTLPAAWIVQHDTRKEGPAVVRNRMLADVATEWVAFLDDDDELLPNHLKLCARYARLSGVDIVYPGYECVGGEDPVNCFGIPFDASLLKRRNFVPVTVLARTELVRAAGGFQDRPDEYGSPNEDHGLWLSMLDRGAKFGHLPQRTWRWYLGDDTTKGRPDRW